MEPEGLHLGLRYRRRRRAVRAEHFNDQSPEADIGKSCIRFKKFEHVDFDVLDKILKESEATLAPIKGAGGGQRTRHN